jgi:hypothetical protein
MFLAGIPLDVEEKEKERKAKELAQVQKKIKVIPSGPGSLPPKSLGKKIEHSVTIEISDLPGGLTKSVLNKKVRKYGSVKDIEFETNASNARVVYASSQEAKNAQTHLDQHTYKGVKISCSIVETITAASIAKRGRLIVRNLAFSCKKEHLMQIFEAFGKIVDCNVPSTAGKARGFGFVQFESVEDAARAISHMNGQNVLKRPVAVDWALGKSQYEILAAVEEGLNEKDEEIQLESNPTNIEEEPSVSNNETNDSDDAIFYSDSDESSHDIDEESVCDDASIQEATLFIRNLSFDTTNDSLKRL